MMKQLKHKTTGMDELVFSNQEDLFQQIKAILSSRLFASESCRHICNWIWELIQDTWSDGFDHVDLQALWIHIELWFESKAIVKTEFEAEMVELLNYFPLHQAIFDNDLQRLQKLITGEV